MTEQVKKGSGMATASLVLGIIAAVVAFLPLVSGWFLALFWLVWILATLSIIFGIIGLVKKQSAGKCIVGLLLSVLAFAAPAICEKQFEENAAESVSNAMGFLQENTDAFDDVDF